MEQRNLQLMLDDIPWPAIMHAHTTHVRLDRGGAGKETELSY